MNGVLRWFRGLVEPEFGPVFVPGSPPPRPALAPRTHIVHAPHMTECECGRQHPDGWVCAASIGGHS